MKRNYLNEEVIEYQGRSERHVHEKEEIGCLSVVIMALLIGFLFVVGIIIR